MSKLATLKNKALAAAGAIGTAAALLPYRVQASVLQNIQNTAQQTAGGAELDQSESLPVLVGNIIGAFLGLIGLILVVFIIYAGYLWMTAQGSEDNIKKAKAIIKNCVIGIILIFAAYSITDFVLTNIVGEAFQ